MSAYELPDGVERLRDVKVCGDCGQPVTNGGGHIHGRFSPVRHVDAVALSDLPAVVAADRKKQAERLADALDLVERLRGGDESLTETEYHARRDAIRAALATLTGEEQGDGCDHEWVDPSNEVVDAGAYRLCLKCHLYAIPEQS
jgi:hypothetical protein